MTTMKDKTGSRQPLPVTALPILRCIPAFEVGMPVVRANFCIDFVTPRARFAENDTPGVLMPFFAIEIPPFYRQKRCHPNPLGVSSCLPIHSFIHVLAEPDLALSF
jgi:hypothetical protein